MAGKPEKKKVQPEVDNQDNFFDDLPVSRKKTRGHNVFATRKERVNRQVEQVQKEKLALEKKLAAKDDALRRMKRRERESEAEYARKVLERARQERQVYYMSDEEEEPVR